MKKLKLTVKQIRTCLMLSSLVVFAYSYLVVYADYTKKTTALQEEAAVVNRQIETRRELLSGSENLDEKIKAVTEETEQILEQYPSRLTIPDTLLFLQEFDTANKLDILSISVGEQQTFYDTTVPKRDVEDASGEGIVTYEADTSQGTSTNPDAQTVVDGEVQAESNEEAPDESQMEQESTSSEYMKGVKSTVTLTFQGTYKAVKASMKYMKEYPLRITMDSISMAYDTTTGLVNGSMTISLYAIEGNGAFYTPPVIDGISIGKKVIFDTVK